ncbi:MAG: hypothetical protein KJO76_00575 [Gammaproteobacteria bacterium]|nr:hypothetical protein [Gammaproteobacteria bacterium]MBT8444761.1 hypothetical protein [Gammaproteobacteria bacterium]
MSHDRRSFIKSTALAGTAGLLTAALGAERASAAMGKGPDKVSMYSNGTYDVVPLVKPSITLGVVQSRVRSVRVDKASQDRNTNLAHMLELIDASFHFSSGADILFFHEFPITGFNVWTRKENLQVAIEIPGPETQQVAAKAKQHGCYIVFGSYARDDDWPDHVLSITTIISPDGEIIDKHWKARNIKGVFPGVELFTTTIYDVLDEYVEMYGADAVLPVTRTPAGNLVTSSVQREPELFRAFAMKGGEIFLRTATGGFSSWDMQATAGYNGVYTAVSNNAYSPNNPKFFADAGSGGSAVYGPRGEVVAEVDTKFETMLPARIPIAQFRERHRQPFVHMDLYREVFATYRNAYAPNLFSDYLPTDLYDAKNFLKDKSIWK